MPIYVFFELFDRKYNTDYSRKFLSGDLKLHSWNSQITGAASELKQNLTIWLCDVNSSRPYFNVDSFLNEKYVNPFTINHPKIMHLTASTMENTKEKELIAANKKIKESQDCVDNLYKSKTDEIASLKKQINFVAKLGIEGATEELELENKLKVANDKIEHLQVQLAGCGVAAQGGTSPDMIAQKGAYGWSPSYQDVLDLSNKYNKLEKEAVVAMEELKCLYNSNKMLCDQNDEFRAKLNNLSANPISNIEREQLEKLKDENLFLENKLKEHDILQEIGTFADDCVSISLDKNIKEDKKTFVDMIKSDARKAVYRVGATQMMKALKASIIALLQSTGKDNQTIQTISELLDSDIGVAILSCICGYSITELVDNNEIASKLSQELRVYGITLAGNAAFETLFGLITSSIIPIIKSLPKENIEDEVVEDKLLKVAV